MSEKALLHWEEMWSDFKLFTQVLDVGKKNEFSQNPIEGCILKPKTGPLSVPVTNLST